ncbi:dienelactone hydrolase family protein [Edaphobacter aggregans]|uniref:dienelactone hydrolase family protein n=1 Tax=Edaphobacter aggregans TaxID=570835 RepID=UPI0012FC66F9
MGRFPVVIYAPSFSSWSWENADLCEYLASYGYVVIASPGMGEKSRESTHDLSGVNAQASDVSFLIGYAASLPNTDMMKVAAIGFSWGGLADLFAASRDNRIKALVGVPSEFGQQSTLRRLRVNSINNLQEETLHTVRQATRPNKWFVFCIY